MHVCVVCVCVVCVCVCVCTCHAQQLQQGGPVTLWTLQHALDDTEEVGQETETHLHEKLLLSLELPHIVHMHRSRSVCGKENQSLSSCCLLS